MREYKVCIRIDRNKILIIKFLRHIVDWGLKTCKDFTEKEVGFDSWLDSTMQIEIIVTAEQLGNLTFFEHSDLGFHIVSIDRTYPDTFNPFDFRTIHV